MDYFLASEMIDEIVEYNQIDPRDQLRIVELLENNLRLSQDEAIRCYKAWYHIDII